MRVSLPVETVRLGQYGHDGRTPIIIGNPVRPSIHVPTPRHSPHPDKLRHSLTTYLDHWIPRTRFEIRFKESPSSTFSSCADRGSNLASKYKSFGTDFLRDRTRLYANQVRNHVSGLPNGCTLPGPSHRSRSPYLPVNISFDCGCLQPCCRWALPCKMAGVSVSALPAVSPCLI